MAAFPSKKRKSESAGRGSAARPKKRFRKQEYYSSSDESEHLSQDEVVSITSAYTEDDGGAATGSNLDAIKEQRSSNLGARSDSDVETSSRDESAGEEDSNSMDRQKATRKRNDPEAFSTSISKILSTKLSQGARKDPVLSRSREAVGVSNRIANERLERRAKAKLRADRKADLERDRVRDVLALDSGKAGEVAEEEKRLRKTAQRGVIKLFNAVRAAQVQGEEAAKEARKKGTIGHVNRENKVNEMSKQGFLDLINGSRNAKPIEEAR